MAAGKFPLKGFRMIRIFEKSFDIEVSHCDCFGRLKASELFKFMQECAMVHAEHMGVGMEKMHSLNRTFVLARMKINIASMPSIGDSMKIKTYPFGIERLFYIREFEISINGIKSAEARSIWLVIDLASRRPVRDRDFGKNFPKVTNENVNMDNPDKPVVAKDAPLIMERTVGYSDVDILGHANNSCYVAWACDCIGSGFFSDNLPFSITINYSSELKETECVKIIGEDMTFCGINESGGEAFSAKVERTGNVQN